MKIFKHCPICERKLEDYKLCENCESILDKDVYNNYKIDEIDFIQIAFSYERVGKDLIKNFKFKKEVALYSIIGDLMIESFFKNNNFKDFTHISYVPMTRKDESIRGFNQSKLLAKYIAKNLDLEFLDSFKKIRNTKTQVGLKENDREKNLIDAFALEKYSKDLIIVDDVITTGTTLREVAKVAKNGGIKKVAALVAATENSN